MQNHMNFTKPNGDDFRFHGAQAAKERKPSAKSLDLFAEELPEQHDLLKGECVACLFTASTGGGSTVSSMSTYGSFS
jgi:hypothetical protein